MHFYILCKTNAHILGRRGEECAVIEKAFLKRTELNLRVINIYMCHTKRTMGTERTRVYTVMWYNKMYKRRDTKFTPYVYFLIFYIKSLT